MRHTIPIDGEWVSFTDKQLEFWAKGSRSEKAKAKHYAAELKEYKENPLSRFLPHGVEWHDKPKSYAEGRIVLPPSKYPKEQENDGRAFLNDYENDYLLMVASRKLGKTSIGAIWMGLRVLNCDPAWPIFTKHGVEYKEFEGPVNAVVASYSWQNVQDLWSVYKEFFPNYELGEYGRGGKDISFGDGRPKHVDMQFSGSKITFLNYNQKQHVWESFKSKYLHADEQIPRHLFTAWEDGTAPYGDYTPAIFTLSGYVLKERPEDTGAGGWIKRDLWDGRMDNSEMNIGRYNMDVESTPTAVMSARQKKKRYDKYVNPAIPRDEKTERRGLGVYFPGWEPGGGLAFGPNVWDRDVHVIKPLWEDDEVPHEWTKYRIVDYADKETSCCLWIAVGDVLYDNKKYTIAVVYRCLYEKGLLIAEIVPRIIDMSHNTRHREADHEDYHTGMVAPTYVEDQGREVFYHDLIDSRISALRQQGETTIDIFRRYGLNNISDADGSFGQGSAVVNEQIMALQDWMRIDKDAINPFTGEKGSPRLFFFDKPDNYPIFDELDTIPRAMPTKTGFDPVIDRRAPHDAVDCLKYWASDSPGHFPAPEEKPPTTRSKPHPYTRY